jgi:hypothetical protein
MYNSHEQICHKCNIPLQISTGDDNAIEEIPSHSSEKPISDSTMDNQ